MAKISTYRLDSFGPPSEASAPRGGLFQLSDDSWRLVFRPPLSGFTCGLLSSQVDVEATRRRRRCRVTVSDGGDDGFRATFVLRARADGVQKDLAKRHSSLDRAAEVVAAVESGEWWQASDAFDTLGWSGTRSIAGVRCLGGRWEGKEIRPTRRTRVLDFGPGGVSLRGWRTQVRVRWPDIATIEVTDAEESADSDLSEDHRLKGGAVIALASHSGERITFHAVLWSPLEARIELNGPLDDVVRPPGETRPLSAGSMAIGPLPVPELSSR